MLQAEQLVQEQVQLLELVLELQQELVQVEQLELELELGQVQVQVQLQAVELELVQQLVQQMELELELPQLQWLELGQQLLGLETLHWLEQAVLTHWLGRSEETSP